MNQSDSGNIVSEVSYYYQEDNVMKWIGAKILKSENKPLTVHRHLIVLKMILGGRDSIMKSVPYRWSTKTFALLSHIFHSDSKRSTVFLFSIHSICTHFEHCSRSNKPLLTHMLSCFEYLRVMLNISYLD